MLKFLKRFYLEIILVFMYLPIAALFIFDEEVVRIDHIGIEALLHVLHASDKALGHPNRNDLAGIGSVVRISINPLEAINGSRAGTVHQTGQPAQVERGQTNAARMLSHHCFAGIDQTVNIGRNFFAGLFVGVTMMSDNRRK